MTIATLRRYSYSETETEGLLWFPGKGVFPTIERPWIRNPNGAPGGKPSESCVPDGAYKMFPWTRPNGDLVYILQNTKLGVYMTPDQHEAGYGRNLILIHAANWAHQVNGCIAPGMKRVPMMHDGEMAQAVTSSRAAMASIRDILGRRYEAVLMIQNYTGASDVDV